MCVLPTAHPQERPPEEPLTIPFDEKFAPETLPYPAFEGIPANRMPPEPADDNPHPPFHLPPPPHPPVRVPPTLEATSDVAGLAGECRLAGGQRTISPSTMLAQCITHWIAQFITHWLRLGGPCPSQPLSLGVT
jgi:hypothetical protein